jgi:hypothetical protein
MFQNYLKIAVRVLWKNKVFVVINLLGLGFALHAVSYLISITITGQALIKITHVPKISID